jgi:hypothetical protein
VTLASIRIKTDDYAKYVALGFYLYGANDHQGALATFCAALRIKPISFACGSAVRLRLEQRGRLGYGHASGQVDIRGDAPHRLSGCGELRPVKRRGVHRYSSRLCTSGVPAWGLRTAFCSVDVVSRGRMFHGAIRFNIPSLTISV